MNRVVRIHSGAIDPVCSEQARRVGLSIPATRVWGGGVVRGGGVLTDLSTIVYQSTVTNRPVVGSSCYLSRSKCAPLASSGKKQQHPR